MPPARDRIPTRPAVLLATGLIAGLLAPGCAREWSARRAPSGPPMLGVVDPQGVYPHGEVLADNGGEGKATRRVKVAELPTLADELAETEPDSREISRASATGPIEVTLLPPINGAGSPSGSSRPTKLRPQASARTVAAANARSGKLKAAPSPTPDSLLAQAKMSLEAMATYQVRLTRRERVGGSLLPMEDVILSIREAGTHAVRLEWPEGPHKGRETIYIDGGPMFISQPHGLVSRIALDPNSPLVLRNSRHPITEAGFDSILKAFERSLAETGPTRPVYAGTETPEGMDQPCDKVVKTLANGEVNTIDFDPATHLPSLVELKAADGSLLESYRFRDVKPDPPDLTLASAFDPDARWGPANGLFSRLAGQPVAPTGVHR